MKPLINETLVEQALIRLEQRGVKPTLAAIRAEMGNHGSKSTIVKHLRAIRALRASKLSESSISQLSLSNESSAYGVPTQSGMSSVRKACNPAHLQQTLKNCDGQSSTPQSFEDLCELIAQLKEENLKYQNEISYLKLCQQHLIEALSASAKI